MTEPVLLPGSVNVDEVLAELKALYIKEHGGALPADEVVLRWRSEVESLQTLELLNKEKERRKRRQSAHKDHLQCL